MRPQVWHIVVLVVALILLFGWKRLPDMARSVGQSMRVFKTEVDEMGRDKERRRDGEVVEGEPAARPAEPGGTTGTPPADPPRHDAPSGGSTGTPPDQQRP